MDLRPGEPFGRSIISHYNIRWQQNLVNSFIYVSVSYLATLEWSWFLPGSSLSPLALKQQRTITFHYGWLLYCGNYTDIQVELLPCAASSTRTSTTGMMQDNHFIQLVATWDTFYLRELLCHREEVLSGLSSVSLSFWVSSSVVSCLGCVCVWGWFCFDSGRHLAFCFSPVLLQSENSWSTTRRFDDRPSLERARHKLKKASRSSAGCWKMGFKRIRFAEYLLAGLLKPLEFFEEITHSARWHGVMLTNDSTGLLAILRSAFATHSRTMMLVLAFVEGVHLHRFGLSHEGDEMKGQSAKGYELIRLTLEYSLRTRAEALSLWSLFVNKSYVLSSSETSVWKPRKEITDLFHCRSWAKHPHV